MTDGLVVTLQGIRAKHLCLLKERSYLTLNGDSDHKHQVLLAHVSLNEWDELLGSRAPFPSGDTAPRLSGLET